MRAPLRQSHGIANCSTGRLLRLPAMRRDSGDDVPNRVRIHDQNPPKALIAVLVEEFKQCPSAEKFQQCPSAESLLLCGHPRPGVSILQNGRLCYHSAEWSTILQNGLFCKLVPTYMWLNVEMSSRHSHIVIGWPPVIDTSLMYLIHRISTVKNE